MKTHRARLLVLGLVALMGLMASEARAATLTLNVYAGSGTGGTLIDSFTTGTSQSINLTPTQLGLLNTDLAGAGFSAYSFVGLQGSSNNPGSPIKNEGFVKVSGQLTATTGSGAGSPITVTLSEGGFTVPSSMAGNKLINGGTASYSGNVPGASASNTITQAFFSDSGSPTYTTSTSSVALPSTGNSPDQPVGGSSAMLGAYVAPYTLTTSAVLSLTETPGGTGAANGFSATAQAQGVVPEPASIVMMLTGMPLPLVVMGLLRRRAKA